MEPTQEKSSDFVRLLARVQAGEAGAAQRLYDDYGPHIRRVVRKRLQSRMRSKFDSMDFVHDVWGSFFAEDLACYDLNSPADLIRLLSEIARHKVTDATRRQTRRDVPDVNREALLEETHAGADNIQAVQQTPSQNAMDEEAWQRFLADQPPVWRRILILTREGHTNESIAAELKIHLRTVQRILHNLLS